MKKQDYEDRSEKFKEAKARSGELTKVSEQWATEADAEIRRLYCSIDRSSYKGRMVNALALGAEEGRDKLR